MTSADFAAAQQRVAARRQQREAQDQQRQVLRRQAHATGPLSRFPPAAQTVWDKATSQWDLIRGREGTRPAFRVGQVDAELLDEELLNLLKEQVGEALKYYGGHLRDDYAAEILLSLRAVLFKLTIWDHNASYGAALQNLRYTDARHSSPASVPPQQWQKALYGLVTVGGRYAWSKWEDYLLDSESGYDEPPPRIRVLSRFSSLLSTTHSIAALTSFLFFLVNGKYRTILDRILRLRLTPTTSQVHREVSFEYLNRQLVWHAFTEFLLFLLPLVGISRWRRWLSRAWRQTQSLFRRGGSASEADLKAGGELGFLPERTCAICYQDQNPATTTEADMAAISGASSGVTGSSQTDITNPYETIPCGCIYCYVCIAQRLEAEDGQGWMCLRCGEVVKECKAWDGDVMEEEPRSSGSGKAVTFAEDDEEGHKGFRSLDPIPMEDEKAAALETDVEGDGELLGARSMVESGDWTTASDNGIVDGEDADVHEAEGIDLENIENTEDADDAEVEVEDATDADGPDNEESEDKDEDENTNTDIYHPNSNDDDDQTSTSDSESDMDGAANPSNSWSHTIGAP